MLRQIEWRVQNRSIAKNGVLLETSLFLWKFCFSLRTSYKELIWCTNGRNAHMRTFCNSWSFIWRCFFPVSILKDNVQAKPLEDIPIFFPTTLNKIVWIFISEKFLWRNSLLFSGLLTVLKIQVLKRKRGHKGARRKRLECKTFFDFNFSLIWYKYHNKYFFYISNWLCLFCSQLASFQVSYKVPYWHKYSV